MNWAEVSVAQDPFGQKLLGQGIPEDVIQAWSVDPQVQHAYPKFSHDVVARVKDNPGYFNRGFPLSSSTLGKFVQGRKGLSL